MDASQNLYAILGIPPEATQDDIREAYRVAARRFHPDANHNEGAEHVFRDIATAYEVLGNPIERTGYDTARRKYQDEPSYFTLRVTPSKRVLSLLDEPQVLYLLLEIVSMRGAAQQKRQTARLNLTLVLDRSTSMKGARLERVKFAAQQIIEQLTADDVLSVVTFSDRADVLIPASMVTDKLSLRAMINMMQADGGTEIFHGLSAGVEQCKRYLGPRMVNHVILLTDGRTFGDEQRCLDLAEGAASDGISISAMGIGDEWNDAFLDSLASRTGGSTTYINAPSAVVKFLNERVRTLGDAYAERIHVSIAPDADVKLESVFRLSPNPQALDLTRQPIPLGTLEANKTATVLIQLQMPAGHKAGFRTVARVDVTGDILSFGRLGYKVLSDLSVEVSESPPPEEPPLAVLDALGKLTLYRMQQKAENSIAKGNLVEGTRQLENLATRLLASGHEDLAQMAMVEARRVSNTQSLSEEGRKSLKYGTRMLLALPVPGGEET
ncbi:VWA domain-containing protein [Aggregatilinea lenta]|uniref:VWA domain-containing protein n=1 Tax=Aggregatilinea lenta TaxID=913108 RepID=UPI000E5B0262|nr:VWA domain-containing protein [Aggregatilinea lenta]